MIKGDHPPEVNVHGFLFLLQRNQQVKYFSDFFFYFSALQNDIQFLFLLCW